MMSMDGDRKLLLSILNIINTNMDVSEITRIGLTYNQFIDEVYKLEDQGLVEPSDKGQVLSYAGKMRLHELFSKETLASGPISPLFEKRIPRITLGALLSNIAHCQAPELFLLKELH